MIYFIYHRAMPVLNKQEFSDTHIEWKDLWWKSLKRVSQELELLKSKVALDDIKNISTENIIQWFDTFKEDGKYFGLDYRKDWKTKEYDKKSVQYVFLLQTALKYLGKDIGKIDWVRGTKTRDVVKKFQWEQWLWAKNGLPNNETIEAIIKLLWKKNEKIEISKNEILERIIKEYTKYNFSTKAMVSSGFTKKEISKWTIEQADDKNIKRKFEVYYVSEKKNTIDPPYYLIISETSPITIGIGKMEHKNYYVSNTSKYGPVEKFIRVDENIHDKKKAMDDFSIRLKKAFTLLGIKNA